MIRKRDHKFCVISRSTGRSLGCYPTKKQAVHRERQVVFYKNLSHSSGGPGSLRAKVRKKSLK
jgi:hypothetical protein